MTTAQRRLSAVLLALLFTILFYQQHIGLNLILFELVIFTILFQRIRAAIRKPFNLAVMLMWFISLLSVLLVHSDYSIAIHVIISVAASGIVISDELHNIISAFASGCNNLLKAPGQFVTEKNQEHGKRKSLPRLRIFLIPVIIIFVFTMMYSFANSIFGDLVTRTLIKFTDFVSNIFDHLNGALLFTILSGLVISSAVVYRYANAYWTSLDEKPENLIRVRIMRNKSPFKMKALHYEFLAGVFLLIALNVLILAVNFIDITNIWFGFSWHGQDFSSMVHEGTYLLIFAVLASIAVVLYYFRGNLNFYKHKWLKPLAGMWIAQNVVLVVSVFIRNYHYVDTFSLSHKRIGVFIFLLIVLIGLVTVWIKVFRTKTSWYLFKTNAMQASVVLVAFSVFNWDTFIARYNFSRGSDAFIYLEHMASLDDSALPYLIKDQQTLEQLSSEQYNKFSFRERGLTPAEYVDAIRIRKENFISDYSQRSVLSWNLADHLSYKRLTNQ
jgi:hypothetical protein